MGTVSRPPSCPPLCWFSVWALGLRRQCGCRHLRCSCTLPSYGAPGGRNPGKALRIQSQMGFFCLSVSLSDLCYSQYMEWGEGGENPPFRRISLCTFKTQPHTDRVFQPSPRRCDGDIPGWAVTPPGAHSSLLSGPDPVYVSLSGWTDGPLLTTGFFSLMPLQP